MMNSNFSPPITRINISILSCFLLFVVLQFFSCGGATQTPQINKSINGGLPTSGELCFKSEKTETPEYIHFTFNNEEIEGRIFLEEEVNGEVCYAFDGRIYSDSLMEVRVHDINNPLAPLNDWVFQYNGKNFTWKNSLGREGVLSYALIDCKELPDTTRYATVAEIEDERVAEYLENNPAQWYESVSPNAMKHNNGWHEYFQLLTVGDSVSGIGMGIEDGEPHWEFDFSGKYINDTLIEVITHYRSEGAKPFTALEGWRLDRKSGRMWLKGYHRALNGSEFVATGAEDIPADYMKIMMKIK